MLVRLFVLGIIYEHDSHGYEIKATAKLWGVERWAKIGFGSIYHALSAMEREGLIVEKGVTQDGNRPPKAIYGITDAGREVFLKMLREALRASDAEAAEADLAMAFAGNLSPQERESLVAERLESLEARCAHLEERLDFARRTYPAIPWIAKSIEHHLLRAKAEREWTSGLVGLIGTFPKRDWENFRPE